MGAFDSQDIRLRKTFLELTDRDQALLWRQRHRLLCHAAGFVRRFYRHLERFPPLKRLLADPERLERLRHSQRRYFRALVGRRCDGRYVEERRRIGVVHERIGLALKWYTGAYALYLAHLLPRLWQDPELDGETRTALTRALIRKVFFDMGLVIDTYVEADQGRIEALKTYAERIITAAPCGLAVTDARLRLLDVNPRFAELAELGENRAGSLEAVLPVPRLRDLAADVLKHGEERAFRLAWKRGGGRRVCRGTIAPVELGDLIESEERLGLIVSLEDITEQESLRDLSEQRRAHLEAVLASVPDGIVVFGADGAIESWNPATEELLGYRGEELSGLTVGRILRQGTRALAAESLTRHLWSRSYARLELQGVRKDGASLDLEVAVERIGYGEPPRYLAILHDVSARKQAEADLDRMARFDPLTHLPNRSLYLERLQVELVRARRHRRRLAVLFLDLDDFKKINDSLGHLAGDRLLQDVARRLADLLRQTDTVARFGGDEFTFLVTGLTTPEAWREVAAKILSAFERPFHLDGREIFVKASIGASLFPCHGGDPDTLLRRADSAMYRAKSQGRNQICCYDADIEADVSRRMGLESELYRALERGEFRLFYQPKVAVADRRIEGFEALLRWNNRVFGPVAPNHFIPALEELGLIDAVGYWVLRTALGQVLAWKREFGRALGIAVNVSSRQIGKAGFAQEVIRLLEEMRFPAPSLELEITESILMEGSEVTRRNIATLRRKGVRFAIDDFGTGYSSLSYLRNFPFDTLKIDRSFIRNLDDTRDLALAGHIVGIGHSLDLTVVAEGVEEESQLQVVTRLGCDLVQGYLFFPPLEADAAAALLDGPVRPVG